MKVICLEEEAFFELVNQTVARISEKHEYKDPWVSGAKAMQELGITSPTTLQKLRDNNEIRYSQHMSKVIMYDYQSLLDYLDRKANIPKQNSNG